MKTALHAQSVQLVTISQYLANRSAQLRLNPNTEGKRVYQIVLSLVLDNGFSAAAKISFPLAHGFAVLDLTLWAYGMRSWIANLGRADRKLFYGLQFSA